MASRMKKIFHRKSQNLQQEPLQGGNRPIEGPSDPTLRATPYDSTAPGGLPETGVYPIRGDGTYTATQGNASANYNRAQQGAPSDLSYLPFTSKQSAAVTEPSHAITAARNDPTYPGSYSTAPSNDMLGTDRTGARGSLSQTPLPEGLSRLSLGNDDGQ